MIKNKINNYGTNRDIPSVEGTSKLSPYIKFGQIHVGTIWKKCNEIKSKGIGYRKYINELGWREFSHSLINYFPEFLKGNFRKEFDRFPWIKNEKFLKAWKNGMTGYPIVDAGMRELYETGWMHNRTRMMVASFLVKNLLIPWQVGAKWFWDTLVDADLANNSAGWQWSASTGVDYRFRVFNPSLQGAKFDAKGEYVRKWIPELGTLSGQQIYSIENSDVFQDMRYPKSCVDYSETRKRALALLKTLPPLNT